MSFWDGPFLGGDMLVFGGVKGLMFSWIQLDGGYRQQTTHASHEGKFSEKPPGATATGTARHEVCGTCL